MSNGGSIWHRWDPHLHAPGTLLNDQFSGDWSKYLEKINSALPPVSALGITDYFCIGAYKAVRDRFILGDLPNVQFIFPNVEMRLDIKTEKKVPINLHFLFSPEDPEHETQIERILGRLEFHHAGAGRAFNCRIGDLIALGRVYKPELTDDHAAAAAGAQQFKVTLEKLKTLFDTEEWLVKNCLVAVAGSSNDGVSGIQGDDSYVLTRQDIERFSDIIFSGTPSQRLYWLGKKAGFDAGYIENKYGSLKPCLHGSDAHTDDAVVAPQFERYCWIKGELNFETLKQVVLEPERRVYIGVSPPSDGGGLNSAVRITVQNAAWIATPKVALNSGLVAIVGARGSGKSALVELLAHGARCSGSSLKNSSFLSRATEYLSHENVVLEWADSDTTEAQLCVPNDETDWLNEARFRYLSQQFVERLCSGPGLAIELRQEIERVVFNSIDPAQRFQTSTFDELLSLHNEEIARRRGDLRNQIDALTGAVVAEDKLLASLKELKEDRIRQEKLLQNVRADLAKLIPKDATIHANRLAVLETTLASAQARVEGVRRRRKSLGDLQAEVQSQRLSGADGRLLQLKTRFADANLAESDWTQFRLPYPAKVDTIILREIAATELKINNLVNGEPTVPIDVEATPLDTWPVVLLEQQRDLYKTKVGIDAEQQRRYTVLQKEIGRLETLIARIIADIERADGAPARRKEHLESRRIVYREVLETFALEEDTLRDLYKPLKSILAEGSGALSKLKFAIGRRVDVDSWVEIGQTLLDLRKTSSFKGEGALKEIAQLELYPAWLKGTPEQVSQAMLAFVEKYRAQLVQAMPSTLGSDKRADWMQRIAAWLFDTSHIAIRYSLQYDSVPIEKLSPGTRGIVLLLLYLVLDKSDLRPIVIDQPEENLDPQSVYEELVPHFRSARERRQVIIVTHNANLVVNTDADQVIIASSIASNDGGLPRITYITGALENSTIRKKVCDILEGGERAFRDRAERYRFQMR
jgi:ABC-type lipoprotein export system ATPase subunit